MSFVKLGARNFPPLHLTTARVDLFRFRASEEAKRSDDGDQVLMRGLVRQDRFGAFPVLRRASAQSRLQSAAGNSPAALRSRRCVKMYRTGRRKLSCGSDWLFSRCRLTSNRLQKACEVSMRCWPPCGSARILLLLVPFDQLETGLCLYLETSSRGNNRSLRRHGSAGVTRRRT